MSHTLSSPRPWLIVCPQPGMLSPSSPSGWCLSRPSDLNFNTNSSASSSLGTQSAAPPSHACFLPGTYNLQLSHLPVCSLVYCLSPSNTEQITRKACLSAHHCIFSTSSRVQQKTNVCSMNELQELRGGTFHAFIISKAEINILSQQRRESVSLLTGCPAV